MCPACGDVALKAIQLYKHFQGGYIEVLASAPLGQRERAVLLQVGEEQILVGVAPGNVTTLHHISHPVPRSESETSLTFKEVWNFARSRQGGNE